MKKKNGKKTHKDFASSYQKIWRNGTKRKIIGWETIQITIRRKPERFADGTNGYWRRLRRLLGWIKHIINKLNIWIIYKR